MKVNIKYKYIIVIVLILLVGVAITTFAYFNTEVIGSPAGSSGMSTGVFQLSISDSTVNISNLAPIYDADYKTQAFKKTFTVTNSASSTLNVCSSIYLDISSISATLKSKYFKYSIEISDTNGNSGYFLYANTVDDFLVINSVFFEPNETISFDLYIWISYADGVDQTNMLGTSMSAVVKAVGRDRKFESACSPTWNERCLINSTSLACKIDSNYDIFKDNVVSTYVTGSGINFSTKASLTNGQGLYSDYYTGTGKNTYFRGGTFCAYTSYASEGSTGTYCTAAGGTWDSTNKQCSLNLSRASCTGLGFTFHDLKNYVTFAGHNWKIIRVDEDNGIRMILADTTLTTSTYFNSSEFDATHIGYMYTDSSVFGESISTIPYTRSVSSGTRYYGTSYSKNGSNQYSITGTIVSGSWNTDTICSATTCPVANYYTCFATSSSSTCTILFKVASFNNATNSNSYYISYGTTSYETAHQNTVNSLAKDAIDTWYSQNMTSYSSYLLDNGFCNDRSVYSGPGYSSPMTYFMPNRRYTLYKPSYTCPNESRDLFTTSSASKGNKALTYPVATITLDEAMFAGLLYTTTNYNITNYLKANYTYWTISPVYAGNVSGYIYDINPQGGYYSWYIDSPSHYAVPVIILKPTTAVASGTGAYDDPFVIN